MGINIIYVESGGHKFALIFNDEHANEAKAAAAKWLVECKDVFTIFQMLGVYCEIERCKQCQT